MPFLLYIKSQRSLHSRLCKQRRHIKRSKTQIRKWKTASLKPYMNTMAQIREKWCNPGILIMWINTSLMVHEKYETTRRGCSETFMCVKTKGTPSPAIFYHVYLTGSSSMWVSVLFHDLEIGSGSRKANFLLLVSVWYFSCKSDH